jgi:succinate-semialdehyde dehydrogenase/glutarate-semialdehyde dehydrogenase
MKTHGLYLNGRFTQPSRETIVVENPATGDTIGRVSMATREQVRQAIADAHGAFASWRALPAIKRGDYLLAIAAELERRKEEIARTVTQENGKPIAQGRVEVDVSIDHLRWFAEEARRAYGRVIPNQVVGKRHVVIKTPVGVVGAISPWNFPLILAVRKIAPALAAGCSVIFKPSELTPLCAIQCAECCDAAKLPAGVFQLVTGDAPMIGEEMLSNPLCRKITFTGSTAVGQKLIAGAAAQVKKLSLELGGHAPAIVFDDAEIDRTIEQVLAAKFRNTGQSCIAVNRIYVQGGIYDRFVPRLIERTRAMKIGNGLDESVEIGPLISERAMQKVLAQIDDAVQRGARILCGGKRLGERGHFIEPAFLENVPDSAVCMTEETFAPVAPILKFDTEEEAIRRANDSPYGLSAYAFTTNLDRMWRLAEQLEAGTIGINDGVPSTSNAPFGGMKQSGWGRELGSEGLEAFLETKHVSIGIIER